MCASNDSTGFRSRALQAGERSVSYSTMSVVEVEEAVKQYGELTAVDRVSFAVESEIVGVLGSNGAGTSTLLKMIVGLLRPDGGRISVAGHDVRLEATAARRAVGYLPEDLELYERLTGREFLRFVAGVKGEPPDDTAIEAGLDAFGMLAKADHLIKEYSLGMKKKTGILAALTGRPRVLVLDEPLNALDAISMRLVEERLRAFRDAGGAVLLSSHVMGFVERVCSRVVILKAGRAVAEETPAVLRERAGLPDAPFDDVFFRYAL
jgi:ABC-2 type transport system ATP-binding protein